MFDNPHINEDNKKRLLGGLSAREYEALVDSERYGLTLYQRFAYPVIRWFFFGQRGSGRSVLLAHVLVRRAIEVSPEQVSLFDHISFEVGRQFRGQEYMARIIVDVANRYSKNYDLAYYRSTHTISMTKRKV